MSGRDDRDVTRAGLELAAIGDMHSHASGDLAEETRRWALEAADRGLGAFPDLPP